MKKMFRWIRSLFSKDTPEQRLINLVKFIEDGNKSENISREHLIKSHCKVIEDGSLPLIVIDQDGTIFNLIYTICKSNNHEYTPLLESALKRSDAQVNKGLSYDIEGNVEHLTPLDAISAIAACEDKFIMLINHPDIDLNKCMIFHKSIIGTELPGPLLFAYDRSVYYKNILPLKMILSGGPNAVHIIKGHIWTVGCFVTLIKILKLKEDKFILQQQETDRIEVISESIKLVESYVRDPDSTRMKIRRDMGYSERDSARIFCLATLLEINLLKC